MSAGMPEREQLMNLLDRAERGALSPAEAALLRRAVLGLLATSEAVRDARYESRRKLARTRSKLAKVLAERDAAQRRAEAATARVERLLVDAGGVSPLLVACPSCGAPAGVACRATRGLRRVPYVAHAPRRRAVGRILFAEALAEAGAA